MSEADNLVDEIMKAQILFHRINKPITKIKMKEKFYSRLVAEVQKDYGIVEVLDANYQPINTLTGVKIEIDNTIKENYEFIYD